jgi:hypothetical protein
MTGVQNELEISATYKDMESGTAIYAVLIPVENERFVFGKFSIQIGGLKGLVSPTFLDRPSTLFRIPLDYRPIEIPIVREEGIEAALVGVVQHDRSGRLQGRIAFTPPAYAKRYSRVAILPVLVVPKPNGLRALIDFKRNVGVHLLVSEG